MYKTFSEVETNSLNMDCYDQLKYYLLLAVCFSDIGL